MTRRPHGFSMRPHGTASVRVFSRLHGGRSGGLLQFPRLVMVTKLLHTRYRVEDLEKTIAFYKEVLGLEEVRRHKSPRGSELVFLKAPQSEELIEICCYPSSGPVQVGPDLTHLAFEVEDLAAFAEQAVGALDLFEIKVQPATFAGEGLDKGFGGGVRSLGGLGENLAVELQHVGVIFGR